MIQPRRVLQQLQNVFARPRAGEPDARVKVTNVTRNTLLARSVEVASSAAKRSKGLLGRRKLPRGEGLWIVPCEAVHTFGMQFAIDLIYLDRRHRIKKIRTNVPPWRMSACLTAHSVIELPAGSIQRTKAQPGDVLEFAPIS